MSTVLRIKGLRIGNAKVVPVDGVDLQIGECESLALVGESGCGKSLTALSILRLLPEPALGRLAGSIELRGEDLCAMDERELRRVRGKRVAMIFQEPMTSLNPVMSCGEQVAETLRLHEGLSARAAFARAIELLDEVRIPEPERRAREYPHQMSGGMRQRVMIAMAISCAPELLIADEPTTALDVTVQAGILELLSRLQRERGMALLHITHDLALVSQHAERIAVMYAGRIVEEGPVGEVLAAPAHPYTLGLLASRPGLRAPRTALPVIPGRVPAPGQRPRGCSFQARCPFARERCQDEVPELQELRGPHRAACFEREAVRAAGEWPTHV